VAFLLAIILISLGTALFFVGTVGLLRWPDFYTRLHAIGKCDTLGLTLLMAGLMVYEGFSLNAVKLLLIVVFVMIANPTATHALARAAIKAKLQPWQKEGSVQ
jgi:multicomponent Na+:H+ antiporter subunit G